MGIVEQMKRLHKQTLLKLQDIKRIVIADTAGVKSENYLNRARTLKDYVSPDMEANNISDKETATPVQTKTTTKKAAKSIKL